MSGHPHHSGIVGPLEGSFQGESYSVTSVELLAGAWYQDRSLVLEFPAAWDVSVVGDEIAPALSPDDVEQSIRQPIDSQQLADLARGKKRVAIIIDDLTRPTPIGQLLPVILEELAAGGVHRDAVTVVVAGGTHDASEGDIATKLGGSLAGELKVIYHDRRRDLVDLGRSERGTPIHVNGWVAGCDLKIGIGGIYPHRVAGFSGGSKITAPGVCGMETARAIHSFRGASTRGGSLDTEFRGEIEDVATRIGLDFVVDVVVNQRREISAVFAGHRSHAFEHGVRFVRERFALTDRRPADVVIADAYPFDATLASAIHRGSFWPLANADEDATRVALAACPAGVSDHVLYPFRRRPTFTKRARRWLRRVIRKPQASSSKTPAPRWRGEYFLLSSDLNKDDVAGILTVTAVHNQWAPLLADLERRHSGGELRVVVYRCAPLFVPSEV